jgi:hypothetical protein
MPAELFEQIRWQLVGQRSFRYCAKKAVDSH